MEENGHRMADKTKSRLARQLRDLRTGKGLTGIELARRLGVSQATVSKIETGVQEPSADYLIKFGIALNLSEPEISQLIVQLQSLREAQLRTTDAARLIPFDFLRATELDRTQKAADDLEASSSFIRVFQSEVVPGLLQIEDYTREIIRLCATTAAFPVERAVRARLRRQRHLDNRRKRFAFVITEAALRARVAENRVMVRQLEHLKAKTSCPNIELGIIPWSARLTVGPPATFYLFDAVKAFVEIPHAEVYLDQPGETLAYMRLFEALQRNAVHADRACQILDRVASDFFRLDRKETATPPTL